MVSAQGRETLPLFPTSESPCGTCTGLCCRKEMLIPLTYEEEGFMRRHGAKMIDAAQPPCAPDERGNKKIYNELLEDCPFLVELGGIAACSIYDDPRKPEACGSFEAGGEHCLKLRDHFGIDQ